MHHKETKQKTLKLAFKDTLPIMAGYIFLGFAFGLLMKSKGYPSYYPIIMSIIIFSGALEFAAVPILEQAFNPLSSFIIGLLLSARHLFYGLPMIKKYSENKKSKPFLIFGLTDETFSLLSTKEIPEDIDRKTYYVVVTFFDYLYWNLGTILGAVFGGLVNINLEGLDFALTALFIVLFIEQLKTRAGKISGTIGIIASLISLLLFGPSKMVVFSMIIILCALLLFRKVIEHE